MTDKLSSLRRHLRKIAPLLANNRPSQRSFLRRAGFLISILGWFSLDMGDIDLGTRNTPSVR